MEQLPDSRLGWLLLSLTHANNVLVAVVAQALVLGPPEVISILGVELPPSVPLGLAAESARFRVAFSEVVAYRVLPENCCAPGAAGEPAGNPRLYAHSQYLELLHASTPIEELHGPGLMHWGLITEHFVLDVLCKARPSVSPYEGAGV